mmetsp:Transcript_15164/g.39012  ORF Transcript_15164/g.39012 Transcript_15164/m.39012 type:complete len:276 (-) Transcript_15164:214-1041(-)
MAQAACIATGRSASSSLQMLPQGGAVVWSGNLSTMRLSPNGVVLSTEVSSGSWTGRPVADPCLRVLTTEAPKSPSRPEFLAGPPPGLELPGQSPSVAAGPPGLAAEKALPVLLGRTRLSDAAEGAARAAAIIAACSKAPPMPAGTESSADKDSHSGDNSTVDTDTDVEVQPAVASVSTSGVRVLELEPAIMLPQCELGAASAGPAVVRLEDAFLSQPPAGSLDLPSIGSLLHRLGRCKPCAYVFKEGCQNGANCTYCHLCQPGEKTRRRTMKQLR